MPDTANLLSLPGHDGHTPIIQSAHEHRVKGKNLWMSIYFPQLCLEAQCNGASGEHHLIYVQYRGRNIVHTVSGSLMQMGIARGMTVSAARSLYPDLKADRLDPARVKAVLSSLAGVMQRFSSEVIECPANALLLEVSRSQTYFGGLDTIKQQIRRILTHQNTHEFILAISPTPASSLLLARTGHSTTIEEPGALRSALGDIPVTCLPLDRKKKQQLSNIGVQVMRDLWRLPRPGLKQRLGTAFCNYLSRLLGDHPDPRQAFSAPPVFHRQYDFTYEVNHVEQLHPVLIDLFTELCDFLYDRDLCIRHYRLSLVHEQQAPTILSINIRCATRSVEQLFMLLQARLDDLLLSAPITAITLRASHFEAFTTPTLPLFNELPDATRANGQDVDLLIDQLRARLGEGKLHSLVVHEDFRPEYACTLESLSHTCPANGNTSQAIEQPRPAWLIPQPQVLKNGAIPGRSGLTLKIEQGPERIESGWWDGRDIRRDYYIGLDQRGRRLWVYQELAQSHTWYLHGLFG